MSAEITGMEENLLKRLPIILQWCGSNKTFNLANCTIRGGTQEAKNKEFKFLREHRNMKDSVEHTNEESFHYFLLPSDPISQLSKKCVNIKLKSMLKLSLLKSCLVITKHC